MISPGLSQNGQALNVIPPALPTIQPRNTLPATGGTGANAAGGTGNQTSGRVVDVLDGAGGGMQQDNVTDLAARMLENKNNLGKSLQIFMKMMCNIEIESNESEIESDDGFGIFDETPKPRREKIRKTYREPIINSPPPNPPPIPDNQ